MKNEFLVEYNAILDEQIKINTLLEENGKKVQILKNQYKNADSKEKIEIAIFLEKIENDLAEIQKLSNENSERTQRLLKNSAEQ